MDHFSLYVQLDQIRVGSSPGASCSQCPLVFVNRHDWLTHRKEAHALPISSDDEAELATLFHANETLVRQPRVQTTVMTRMLDTHLIEEQELESTDAISPTRTTQKYPSTFQCFLCPKRFTRSFALVNHARTHAGERPFVCTSCGKAFSRQHDRKTHEMTHSGERKWVCRGQSQDGMVWGCGKQFTRATHLRRHWRSKNARACNQPMLDDQARVGRLRPQFTAASQDGGANSSISSYNSPTMAILSQQEQYQSSSSQPGIPWSYIDVASHMSINFDLSDSSHPQSILPSPALVPHQSIQTPLPVPTTSMGTGPSVVSTAGCPDNQREGWPSRHRFDERQQRVSNVDSTDDVSTWLRRQIPWTHPL